MSTREVTVLSCFIGIPILLVVLHLFLSYRKKAWYGLIVPVIWGIMSYFIVSAGTGQAYKEMIIFCAGVDGMLLLVWGILRKVKASRA